MFQIQNTVITQTITRTWGKLAFVVIAVALGLGNPASAAYLTANGDFEGQGTPIGAPWSPTSGSGNGGSASAQSPFTGAFPDNGIGMNTPASAGNPYIVGNTAGFPTLITSGMLYLNADFRTNSDETEELGDHSLVVTKNSLGSERTAAIYLTSTTFTAENGGGSNFIIPIVEDTWYSLQLTLDVSNGKYSGRLTPFGQPSILIPTLNFVNNNGINCIFADAGAADGLAPNYDLDNFVLTSTPLPEPSSLVLAATALVGGTVVRRCNKNRKRS